MKSFDGSRLGRHSRIRESLIEYLNSFFEPPNREAREQNPDRADLFDLDQLDVKHQHALRLTRLALVGQRLGDPESTLFALDHHLQTFRPAGDHSIDRKRRGRARSTELSNILPSVVQPV